MNCENKFPVLVGKMDFAEADCIARPGALFRPPSPVQRERLFQLASRGISPKISVLRGEDQQSSFLLVVLSIFMTHLVPLGLACARKLKAVPGACGPITYNPIRAAAMVAA